MKKLNLLLLSLIISLSTNSFAGVLIEPYIGVGVGLGEQTSPTANLDSDYLFPMMGGRLGYQFLGFMGGLDYSYQTFTMNNKYTVTSPASSGSYKDKMTKSQFALFAGYNLPVLFRIWGSYYFKADMEGKDAAGTLLYDKTESFSGSGYGLGVGFTGLPFVSINLEYRMFAYDEWEDSDSSPSSGTYGDSNSAGSSDLKIKELLVSVSIPFNL